MATLSREGDELVLALSTWERLGALHGDVRVPLSAVQEVSVSDEPFARLRGMRAPGAGVPRRLAVGTWRYRGGKDFAALYGGRSAVIVRLSGAPYGRLLVSARDAEALAARLRTV